MLEHNMLQFLKDAGEKVELPAELRGQEKLSEQELRNRVNNAERARQL
jgi:hypothetical protein